MAAQREWFEQDYYKTLGVADTATPKEITKAYRKLARELHPDKNPGNAEAEERFKSVSAAYDVLGDETKRAEYDEVRRLGPMGGPSGAGPGGFTFNMNDADAGGLGDILGQMFGRGARGPGRAGGGGSSGAGPRRGADVEAELTLDFEDAARGMTTTLHLTSDAQCSTCHGSGARPGTAPRLCPQCGGRGVIDDNQGLFSFSSPCRRCGGAGTVIEDPCPTCRGAGVEKRAREVQARIPAGVSDGQTIRLKGRGAPGATAGLRGTCWCRSTSAPHPLFSRTGNDLTTRVAVTFAEAALGADVAVPTLDGAAVTLRIKPGTQPGSRHRVKGKGIVGKKATGDLIVTIDVMVPTALSERSARRSSGSPPPPAPGRGPPDDAPAHAGRVRDLGGGRAGRDAPPDVAHLRASRVGPPGPDVRAATAATATPTSRCCGGSPSWPSPG